MIQAILQIIRPGQWAKNLFVVIPAFFAAQLTLGSLAGEVGLGFLAFCLMASGVYVWNDLQDIKEDQLHPEKCKRPLASGALNKSQALVLMIALWTLAFACSWWSDSQLGLILLLYWAINMGYSLGLKKIAILDITLISLGFLLRIFAGGEVAHVPISHWLIVLTFLLAMILALSKRRGEFVRSEHHHETRAALQGYNLQMIDLSIVFMAAVTVVSYLMYTLSEEVIARVASPYLYFTTFFVIIGILRYIQLTIVFNQTESPTKVFWTDTFLQIVLLLWGASFGYLLYF